MDLSRRIFGWVRLRLTSADCDGRLREISREISVEYLERTSPVSVEFTVSSRDAERIRIRDGEKLDRLGSGGGPKILRWIREWKLMAGFVLALFLLTWYLPGRIWFVEVRGNENVPARLIEECAQACGVYFGASRRELRSEQVKNHLLHEIDSLRWAGVNTFGCRAVITVTERNSAQEVREFGPGDLVARTDGVISQLYAEHGTVLVQPGHAVREGDVLISGNVLDRASGEVYGITKRKLEVILPEHTLQRRENGRCVTRRTLIFGKKAVNFSIDSGILHGTCVKMRKMQNMMLPGGFVLPVALVTETWFLCDVEHIQRTEADEQLIAAARDVLLSRMIAGAILDEDVTIQGNRLKAVFECRELIGVFRPGIHVEGDTNDRENGECGAG